MFLLDPIRSCTVSLRVDPRLQCIVLETVDKEKSGGPQTAVFMLDPIRSCTLSLRGTQDCSVHPYSFLYIHSIMGSIELETQIFLYSDVYLTPLCCVKSVPIQPYIKYDT